jgi:hypothetical protein
MKKKKEPKPCFFTNIPRKELKKLLKGDEAKPMTKKNEKKAEKKETAPKKSITQENIARMIEEWDDKTIGGWSTEFGVSYQTILKMAEAIRKEDATLCPPKPKKPKTRTDLAKSGIALYRKKQGKK